MKQSLSDQFQRDRFVYETTQNFSVVAPAGVGKTTAIVDRIVTLAQANSASNPIIPRLVLVTYTRKAAQEMLLRARNELVKSKASANTMAQLRQAYFGTIHSYCLNLVQRFALRMGLPPKLEIMSNEEVLWAGFIRSRDVLVPGFPENLAQKVMQLMPIQNILDLARKVPPKAYSVSEELTAMPEIDIQPILDVAVKGRGAKGIEQWQNAALAWQRAFNTGKSASIPNVSSKAKDIVDIAPRVFSELRDWLGKAALIYAKAIANEYQQYKLQQGVVSFDDIIHLAVRVVRNSDYVKELRLEEPIILLDEAQDTDKNQFEVLLEVARSVDASGQWINSASGVPEPGRFSMVGDPQQAIYGSRTDVSVYEGIRKRLCDEGGAVHLSFQVTMRCDCEIVRAMNALMPEVLDNRAGQVAFVPMDARPSAHNGQVIYAGLDVPEMEKPDAVTYAKAFTRWFQSQSLQSLRAKSWEQVAILCPRKAWLAVINDALSDAGVDTQIVSGSDIVGDNPAYAWVTALVKIITEPYNSFEIVGVLREIFALSDGSIARYVDRYFDYEKEHPINLVSPPEDDSPVYKRLDDLRALRSELDQMSLHDALAHLVARTQLRERIQSVPGFKPEACLEMLDHLYELADSAEEQRQSLDEWVCVLEERLQTDASENNTRSGAVQLLTIHKSKGLGFEAVIMPFSHRPISDADDTYPKYLTKGGEVVIVDSKHKEAYLDLLDENTVGGEHEKARLVYVAMTRARHTLVLFDDSNCVPLGNKKEPALSVVDYLAKEKPQTRSYLATLISTLEEDSEIQPTTPIASVNDDLDLPDYSKVKAEVENTWKRVTPSSLAEHSDDELYRYQTEQGLSNDFEEGELENSVSNDPAAYGNWWHETMEKLPWSEGIDVWECKAEERLQVCPDADRGSGELGQLFNSDLVKEIRALKGQCYCEVPMLWGSHEMGQAFEGFIDFLAVTPEKILLVDWKTDRQAIDKIVGTYKKQIMAYREALADAYSVEIKTCIYSTVHAQSITL